MNEDIKQIIGKFVLTIPELYQGQERINYIIEKYNVFSEQERIAMRRYLNKVLTTMIEMEASDIEIGGFGSDGFIWMRVYGKKQRVKEIPRFSMDEFAVIIINLLNENQRRYLTVTKSLDFSYTFSTKENRKMLDLERLLISILIILL